MHAPQTNKEPRILRSGQSRKDADEGNFHGETGELPEKPTDDHYNTVQNHLIV